MEVSSPQAISGQHLPPRRMLVASSSEQQRAQWLWPGLGLSFEPSSPSKASCPSTGRFTESSQACIPCAPLCSCSAAARPGLSLQPSEFSLPSSRRATQAPAARHIQQSLTGMHSLSFEAHGGLLITVLTHMANQQQQLAERVRAWRPRNPFTRFSRRNAQKANQGNSSGISSGQLCKGPKPGRTALRLYEAARDLERALDPVAAGEAFLVAADADPRQAEWLSLAAKQFSDATYRMPVGDTAKVVATNTRAVELANQAAALNPEAAHAYVARCVARGRLALVSDNRSKVALAKDAADDAATALRLEPDNDYAHHVNGRWHFEMAGLNALTRTLVRFVYGTALMQGSYTSAIHHYSMATELAPRVLIHRVALARAMVKAGRQLEAVQQLELAMACDVDDLNASLERADGEIFLAQLRRTMRK